MKLIPIPRLALGPGNYPQPIWNYVKEVIKGQNNPKFLKEFEEIKERTGYLMILDIHNFSKFCDSIEDRTMMIKFLRQFYKSFSDWISVFNEEKIKLTIYKYIGDAIFLAHFGSNIVGLINVGKNLVKLYKEQFKKKYEQTDLAVLISKAECYECLIKGSNYSDYSIWGKNINSSFKYLKRHDFQGKVAITPDVFNDLENRYKEGFEIDGILIEG